MLGRVAVRVDDDALDPAVVVADGDAALTQVDRHPTLLDALLERLPHLARAQPWVLELLDQRRDRPAVEPDDLEQGLEQ
jgi:hypothetical protein